MEHLVYCDAKAKVLEKLIAGEKTMIVRGAAGRKLPHGRVFAGEKLYFIENNGDGLVKATATVKTVFNSEKMTPEESIQKIEELQSKLNLSKAQFDRWAGKKVLCLIEVTDVQAIEPLKFERQKNMDDWITVESIEDILEGADKKYNSIRVK